MIIRHVLTQDPSSSQFINRKDQKARPDGNNSSVSQTDSVEQKRYHHPTLQQAAHKQYTATLSSLSMHHTADDSSTDSRTVARLRIK